MTPKVSVIVPIYNVEKYLERCLKSIQEQKLDDIEIILVDDGSPDKCPEICDQYAQTDERIKVIHKKNAGLGFARNSGIEVATGEYVAFIDSDDYISNDFLYELYYGAKKHDADACLGGMVDKYGDYTVEFPHIFANQVFSGEEIKSKLLKSMLGADYDGTGYSGMSVWRGVYKKSILDAYSIQFPSERQYISEDIIFDISFFVKANTVAVIGDTGYFYCHNDTSLTATYRADRFEKCRILYLYEKELVKDLQNSDEYIARIMNTFLANVRVVFKQEVRYCQNMGSLDKKERVNSILEDSELQKAVKLYDYSRLPMKQKIFCYFIEKRKWRMLYLLASLQNKSKEKLSN